MSNHHSAANARADEVFDALGDPTRRQIIARLRPGPTPVGKLADQLTIGRPAVSKHLRVLEGAGLVRHESRGTRNLYALAPEGMSVAQQWLVGMWDTALAAYADAVDAAVEEQSRRQVKASARSQRPSRRKRTGPGGSA
ncbi:MAG TPA: metalloregulator ArsR/SmtB family transcription factor [Nocardioides sp.]|nr:metalloregulator ArsR/SmtB family transcription factor [Nocardioides sp.]